jgi:IS5 family transposase
MATDDFFRARLDQMIDLRHPLAVLAQRLPWTQIEATLAPAFAHRPRPGKVLADCDLFGTSLELAGAAPSPMCCHHQNRVLNQRSPAIYTARPTISSK